MAVHPAQDSAHLAEEVGGALRQALIVEYGPQAGAAATTAALSWGRSHPNRLRSSANLVARLHQAGRRWSQLHRPEPLRFPGVPDAATHWIEPALPEALAALRRQDRAAVLLCHGYGWSHSDVAAVLGVEGARVARAADSGLAKLRSGLDSGAAGHGRELRDQIVAYAELLDDAAPDLDDLAPTDRDPPDIGLRWRVAMVVVTVLLGALIGVGYVVGRDSREPTGSDRSPANVTASAGIDLPLVGVELVNRSAISSATFSNWVHQSAAPGAITVVDGTYHMLSAAYGPGVATVAYSVSDDGVVWTQVADQPVLDLSEAPWAPREFDRATPRSVVVDSEGTWQLFFDVAWFDREANQVRASIGRVVTRDPAGTWIFDPQPIISRSDERPWMAERVASPSVIAADGGLVMLFVGEGTAGGVVGLGQSQNGADWEVRPDPVFAAAKTTASGGIAHVDLLAVPGGMAMFFADGTAGARGLAVSANRLDWVPHPDNPLLSAGDASTPSLFDSEFVYTGATVLAYVETGAAQDEHEVAVLRISVDIAAVLGSLLGEGG